MGAGVAYSATSGTMAGGAGYSNPQFAGKGGTGGLAVASNIPVSAPVTVTVGAGGPSGGANPGFNSTGGVVLVEYVG
jgi:hypothetical protein